MSGADLARLRAERVTFSIPDQLTQEALDAGLRVVYPEGAPAIPGYCIEAIEED